MAMLKMQRVYVYALLKYCKDILEALQRRGVVEIENLNIEDSVFFKDDTSAYQAQYQRMASTAIEANEILSRYAKRKKGLLSSFKGRKQLSREEYDKLVDETQDILRIAYDIISCQKNIDTNEAEKVKAEVKAEVETRVRAECRTSVREESALAMFADHLPVEKVAKYSKLSLKKATALGKKHGYL